MPVRMGDQGLRPGRAGARRGAGRAAGEGAKQIHLRLMIAVVTHPKPSRGFDAPSFDISHPRGAFTSYFDCFSAQGFVLFLAVPHAGTDIA